MVFFRLGKLDRGDKDEKSRLAEPLDRADAGGASGSGGAPGIASNAGAGQAMGQERDRSEKKKKPKDLEPGSSAGVPQSNDRASASGGVPSGAARAQAGLSVNDFISKTKNQQRQGLKPSGPELIAYARYLGIDPVADHDLLWIAVEALEAPLPSDWTEHFDSNDRVFYYNATMRVSSWTHPLEHIYRETYKTIVNFRNSNLAMGERTEKLQQLQLEVKQMENDVHKEIAQWTEHTDEQGNRFYFNREERQSTWTDPRPAKCQILYLRMKMLRLLQSGSGATPGFSDHHMGDAHALGSRYAELGGGSHSHFDDPPLKRPKVGSSGRTGTHDTRETGAGHDTREGSTIGDGGLGRSSPDIPSDDHGASDTDSDNPKQRKKKKKKKKNKHDQAPEATPPPRPGGASAQMKTSQSEPSVGGKPLLGSVDDVHGGGLGKMQPSPSGPQSLSHLGPLDAGEGLSTLGRARIKAGVRLEPISTNPLSDVGGLGLGGEAKGVRNSASVPALQP